MHSCASTTSYPAACLAVAQTCVHLNIPPISYSVSMEELHRSSNCRQSNFPVTKQCRQVAPGNKPLQTWTESSPHQGDAMHSSSHFEELLPSTISLRAGATECSTWGR